MSTRRTARRNLYAPTLNLNGTDCASLVAAYRRASTTLTAAIDACAAAAPNGRDFQSLGQDYDDAAYEHRVRMATLDDLRDDYYDLAHDARSQSRHHAGDE